MAQKFSLVGIDGNAFSIMAYVSSCMREVGYTRSDVIEYRSLATSSNYHNLNVVSASYIDKCNNRL